MKRLIPLVLAVFCAAALSACNTMAGFGEDVESVGESIEDEATD